MRNLLDDEQVERAMIAARIPKLYRGKHHSLNTYGETGLSMKKWVDEHGTLELAAGSGKFIVTVDVVQGMGFFYTLARAVLLKGVSTLVVSLPALIDRMDDGAFFDRMDDVTVLFVGGFYIDGYDKKPFSYDTQNRLEWVLSNRIRNQQAVVFQSTAKVMKCDWWSNWFLQLVAAHVGAEILI